MNLRIITIKRYEMICRTRWGWHTFREGKDHKGKVIGFRFLGVGFVWAALPNDKITQPGQSAPLAGHGSDRA